jgi:predicted Zn-dependent protease
MLPSFRHGPDRVAQVTLLKGTPEDRDVYITLSQMYSRLKRWPEAEAALEAGTALDEGRRQAICLFLRARITSARKI